MVVVIAAVGIAVVFLCYTYRCQNILTILLDYF